MLTMVDKKERSLKCQMIYNGSIDKVTKNRTGTDEKSWVRLISKVGRFKNEEEQTHPNMLNVHDDAI